MYPNKKGWLIIGGAGYIGAHVSRTFIKNKVNVHVLDNLSTGLRERLPKDINFHNFDCSNTKKLNNLLNKNNIEGIVHLAAFKQARESKRKPLKYWSNNVTSMIEVLNSLRNSPVKYFVFSSSCSIYGNSEEVKEETKKNPLSPYGRTKNTCEIILNDCAKELDISWISLRYFNVIGNDDFQMSHDNSKECLLPSLYNCYKEKKLPSVFGTNFKTKDGSALRDYLDVRDLSETHFLAAKYLTDQKGKISMQLNVGTGKPYSVIEIIDIFAKRLSISNNFNDLGRNSADPDAVWANTNKFFSLFHWKPKWTLEESIKSFIDSKNKECNS